MAFWPVAPTQFPHNASSSESKACSAGRSLGSRAAFSSLSLLQLLQNQHLQKCIKTKDFNRDYILDTRQGSCYPFFVLERFNFATCFLRILWPLGVNKCFIASSVVMSFGCFSTFFFMVPR